MLTQAERSSRRVGRMEALASDLSQVKPGYQPTELEMVRALTLHAALGEFIQGAKEADPGVRPAGEAGLRPAPEPVPAETKTRKK